MNFDPFCLRKEAGGRVGTRTSISNQGCAFSLHEGTVSVVVWWRSMSIGMRKGVGHGTLVRWRRMQGDSGRTESSRSAREEEGALEIWSMIHISPALPVITHCVPHACWADTGRTERSVGRVLLSKSPVRMVFPSQATALQDHIWHGRKRPSAKLCFLFSGKDPPGELLSPCKEMILLVNFFLIFWVGRSRSSLKWNTVQFKEQVMEFCGFHELIWMKTRPTLPLPTWISDKGTASASSSVGPLYGFVWM